MTLMETVLCGGACGGVLITCLSEPVDSSSSMISLKVMGRVSTRGRETMYPEDWREDEFTATPVGVRLMKWDGRETMDAEDWREDECTAIPVTRWYSGRKGVGESPLSVGEGERGEGERGEGERGEGERSEGERGERERSEGERGEGERGERGEGERSASGG